MEVASAFRPDVRWATAGAAAVVVAVAAWLHLRAGYVFPRPWPDEAHFLTPAITLARSGRLAVPELNAPDGIFWMPTGYYVAQVPLLLLRVDALVGARLLSFVGVLAFGAGVGAAAVRAGVSRVIVFCALLVWVCMPRVVAIANIARMEGVVLGLVGLGVWLVARDRWPGAVAVSLLGPLVHPIGVVLPVAVLAAAIVRPGVGGRCGGAGAARPPSGTRAAHATQRRGGLAGWTRAEKVLVAGAVLLVVAQLVYFALHAEVAAAHLDFQLNRKAGRPVTVRWWQAALVMSAAVGGAAATLRWRRGAPPLTAMWILLAIAGGFAIVDVVGREMWYEPLGRETAVLLLGLVAAAALARVDLAETTRYVAAVLTSLALVFAAGVALRSTLVHGWYGMTPNPGARAEWHAFTIQAASELQRLDAAGDEPQIVVIDPLSGLAQEIFARRWSRLRFVQPTPATPMDTLQADYVLATPGVPFTTDSLVGQWGPVPPALDVGSERGSFRMQLFANPAG